MNTIQHKKISDPQEGVADADWIGQDSAELPLDLCREYDAAAKWCARRGLKGVIGDPLPANMATDGALKYIQDDPEAFQQRVKQFAYERAMNQSHVTIVPGRLIDSLEENG